MIKAHDPSNCRMTYCERCYSFGEGLAVGRANMLRETAATLAQKHPRDCYCSPCVELRDAVESQSGGKYASLARLIPKRRPVLPPDEEEDGQ